MLASAGPPVVKTNSKASKLAVRVLVITWFGPTLMVSRAYKILEPFNLYPCSCTVEEFTESLLSILMLTVLVILFPPTGGLEIGPVDKTAIIILLKLWYEASVS
ncbi:hypothetical protein SFC50_20370 [Bacillus infantis]|uniref:hypothetical protein n=1 Tax=Bacillus infantis TaxID=324767 RepID=UPI0039820A2A